MCKPLRFLLLVLSMMAAFSSWSYHIEVGEYYLGGGIGANVNVVRMDGFFIRTPQAQLPILAHLDYVLMENISLFSGLATQFGAGSFGLLFQGGGKYWLTVADAPFVPYVSLALTPSFLFPVKKEPMHFNLGLSPGAGLNFFLTTKILLGAHAHFNPSLAFADGDRRFEFSVMAFFDLTMRV